LRLLYLPIQCIEDLCRLLLLIVVEICWLHSTGLPKHVQNYPRTFSSWIPPFSQKVQK
jgi:hypothetical protein